MSAAPPALRRDEAAPRPTLELPVLSSWRIRAAQGGQAIVRATDWLSALGAALHKMGLSEGLGQVACEVLPNGQIIANDLTRRRRFTVQRLPDARAHR